MKKFSKHIFAYSTALCIIIFLLSACNRSEKTQSDGSQKTDDDSSIIDDRRGEINVECDDVLVNVILHLADQFRDSYPNIKVNITANTSSACTSNLQNGKNDIAVVSTPLSQLKNDKFEFTPFANDILVMIVNFNNQLLQPLAIKGISQKTLTKIFTGTITNWDNVVTGEKSNEPLKLFLPHKQSGSVYYLSQFAGINTGAIKADIITEKEIADNVAGIPVSIGFCSHTLAYDASTTFRKTGLYIPGIDMNNNGRLDNEELIWDDLSTLKSAVQKGKAPMDLVRNFTFVLNKENQNNEISKLFIQWVHSHGQNIITDFQFYLPQQSK